jgi:hypothetical protein
MTGIDQLPLISRQIFGQSQPLVGHSVGSETFKLRHTKLQRMVAKDIGHQNVQLHLLPI